MSERKPITPTRVIPADEHGPVPLPAPASPPPPPPVRPPAPPVPAEPPDWWRTGRGPASPPPPPIEVHHHHIHVDLPPIYLPATVDPLPVPGPRWWQRLRIGCAAAGFTVCGPWAWVLKDVRDDGPNGLAGAWVMALIVLTLIAVWDNACRIAAKHADPEHWAPRIRAAVARTLLWAALIGIALTLPITTAVFFFTGVHT